MAYTNSSLVSYTKISPNKTSPRTHAIDTITIHCVVGQCSVETLGEIFYPSSRQASSNYGVGKDGRIGMYVEEKDRSWCSSNAANDHRAITIEVASDTTEPYAVNDTAYAATIDLVTDICKRNGISKLVWSTDKNTRVNHLNGCNMTVHRDYANKSCPGTYLYNRMGEIAAAVNARLGNTTTATDDGSMTDAEMYAYFKSQGLNDYGAAGLMGNLYAESGLAANNLQNTGNTKLGMTDAQYTAAVDGGTYANFVKDGYGYGLAQWTYYSRKQALLDFMTAAGVSIGHKKKQCEFIVKELAGYSSVLKTLKSAASVKEASDAVLTGYEKPADQSDSVKTKRAGYGQTYYDKYAESASGGTSAEISADSLPTVPFTVKVIISDLNYRDQPSMSGAVKGQTGKGTFTITEVSNGWGKLKSGAGWIYLLNTSYCTIGKTVSDSSTATSAVPYKVKVSISDLNIRTGPGTNYAKTGKFTGVGTFTIVEESSGTGSDKGWGKLKSGAGWISLAYCTKV